MSLFCTRKSPIYRHIWLQDERDRSIMGVGSIERVNHIEVCTAINGHIAMGHANATIHGIVRNHQGHFGVAKHGKACVYTAKAY